MREERFERLKKLNKEIDSINEMMLRLRSQAEKMTTVIDGLPRGSGMRSTVEESVLKLYRLMEEYQRLQMEHVELHALLADDLFDLDAIEAGVLSMRYLERKSYREIALTLNQSISNVFRYHRQGLKHLFSLDDKKIGSRLNRIEAG